MKTETRHGATQPENERSNEQLLLRLAPTMKANIRKMARAKGLTVSQLVENLAFAEIQRMKRDGEW